MQEASTVVPETREVEVAQIVPPSGRMVGRRRGTLVLRTVVGDRYEVIGGWDAYDRAVEQGHRTIPAVVRLDAPANARARLLEHQCIATLDPIEEAQLIREIMAERNIGQREFARAFKYTQPQVCRRLALLRLSRRDQLRVASGEMTIDAALAQLVHA